MFKLIARAISGFKIFVDTDMLQITIVWNNCQYWFLEALNIGICFFCHKVNGRDIRLAVRIIINQTIVSPGNCPQRCISASHRCGRMDCQAVIFADKQDRQSPETGKIQTFPKNTFVHCAIAEKYNRNFIGTHVFFPECSADCNRNRCPNDGRCHH